MFSVPHNELFQPDGDYGVGSIRSCQYFLSGACSHAHAISCEILIHKYSCGCTKNEEFKQCDARAGTNVRCSPTTKESFPESTHMCFMHMVKPGIDKMSR
ncbi:hypothetical protein BT63DRAFT_116899 [Microthyrium microscopicum]|uniref:Uncharacterized protein n=1 Tax=Microthyrium microscopicum TaxID=703497 RepID=A0A6A6TXD0_9PEZI|nr:hypothetical protein BT63DRAFT_116899 [Microthyrium microscopicum]